MARNRRGIHEELIHVENVLPDVTDAELLDLAGLTLLEPSGDSPFRRHWQYGGPQEREVVDLKPGESILLRSVEADAARLTWADQGIAFIPQKKLGTEEALRLRVDALRRVHTFYRDRGAPKIAEFRRNRNVSKDDLDDYRYDILWPYFKNEAVATVIEKRLKELQAELVKASREKKSEKLEKSSKE